MKRYSNRNAFPIPGTVLLCVRAIPAALPAQQARVAADTQRTTAGGATFTVPGGWSISAGASSVVLEPAEPDSHVVIVDLRAASAAAAVADAWTAYHSDRKRPFK